METQYLINLAQEYLKEDKLEEALNIISHLEKLQPNNVSLLMAVGNMFLDYGECDKAIERYKKIVKLSPYNYGSFYNMGDAFMGKGDIDSAISCYQKAISINPKFEWAYNNLGMAYKEKMQFDEAIDCFKKVIEINPKFVIAYNNLANALSFRGDHNEALAYYRKALEIDPNFPDAHWNLGQTLLLLGDFKNGWDGYEWRWKIKDFQNRKFPMPLWDGSPLYNRTLFIYDEQGVGDKIMFASCLKEIAHEAKCCIVETEERLVPIFKRSFPNMSIIPTLKLCEHNKDILESADFRIPIGSLPRFLRTDVYNFPKRIGYLIPDTLQVDLWKKRFSVLDGKLKVGISWKGGKDLDVQRVRSTFLEDWKDIFSFKNIKFINLQYGNTSEEVNFVQKKFEIKIYDWVDADPLKNLDFFAAEVFALDLIISVDNATVHMAGALGKTVWTLLPFKPDWRWMLNREDSPWYPTMRLFRQSSPGDWEGVFKRVYNELMKIIKTNE